mgnify:FL=1
MAVLSAPLCEPTMQSVPYSLATQLQQRLETITGDPWLAGVYGDLLLAASNKTDQLQQVHEAALFLSTWQVRGGRRERAG